MEVVLLAQIALSKNNTAAVDPASLLNQASCYACFATNVNEIELMKLALLAQIAP